ncbi:MAG TPA: TraB/VirB10 family protein, partial [Gammaproteobacteria bacterium]|nr:TraB/VirB10 family protein [Gammaproteobacteria bacterium]
MDIPKKVKLKQMITVITLMLVVFVVIHLLSHWFRKDNKALLQTETKKINLPNAGNADLQSLWVQQLEAKIKAQSEALNLALKDMEKQKQEAIALKDSLTKTTEDLTQQWEQKNAMPIPVPAISNPLQSQGTPRAISSDPFLSNVVQNLGNSQNPSPTIISIKFKLSETQKIKPKKENYISAGSFVEAVILGGIDAAAGVSSQNEPRPVLLRLVDLSVLPNRVRTDIRDCHVIAAGFGDISSERAYIRTERLSCTLLNGDVLEEKIEAYIAGEDGKDGVRGTVVRREGDLIFNSFLAGTIAGLGKGMSQSFGTSTISPLGMTKSTQGSEVLKSGLYGGAGESGDQLQKYFIQRA